MAKKRYGISKYENDQSKTKYCLRKRNKNLFRSSLVILKCNIIVKSTKAIIKNNMQENNYSKEPGLSCAVSLKNIIVTTSEKTSIHLSS